MFGFGKRRKESAPSPAEQESAVRDTEDERQVEEGFSGEIVSEREAARVACDVLAARMASLAIETDPDIRIQVVFPKEASMPVIVADAKIDASWKSWVFNLDGAYVKENLLDPQGDAGTFDSLARYLFQAARESLKKSESHSRRQVE